ncbi:MAG: hypothetical protein JWO78_1952 [Micavibrio sp.]|nr:hypothetical protein [Micavibrio sp.]
MNKDIFSGKWKQFKGDLQSKWGKLTDDDLETINGDIEKLAGKLQESYGLTRDQVESHLAEMKDTSHTAS